MMTDDERAVLIATRLLPAAGACHARTVYREGPPVEIIWCNAEAVGQWPNGGQYCATHIAELDAWAEREL